MAAEPCAQAGVAVTPGLRDSSRGRGCSSWDDAAWFNCDLDLDLDGGTQSGRRAALVTGIRQAGGDESATGWYRLNVFDVDGDVVVRDYVVPPDFPVPASLSEYTDRQLVAELERRLWGR